MAANDDIELDLKKGENEDIGQYRLRVKQLAKNNPKAKFKLEINDSKGLNNTLANLGSELLKSTLKGKISNIQLNCDNFGSPNAPRNPQASNNLQMLYQNNPQAQFTMKGKDPSNIISVVTGMLKNVLNHGNTKIELTAKDPESAKPLIQILSKTLTKDGMSLANSTILQKIIFSNPEPKTGKTPNAMTPENGLGSFIKNAISSLNPFDTRRKPRPDDKFRSPFQ